MNGSRHFEREVVFVLVESHFGFVVIQDLKLYRVVEILTLRRIIFIVEFSESTKYCKINGINGKYDLKYTELID